MNKRRPVYLSMFQFAWPITALASIAHRASGIVLFAGIGYLLWLLDLSLSSQSGFADAQEVMAEPIPKLILLGVLAMLLYHLTLATHLPRLPPTRLPVLSLRPS